MWGDKVKKYIALLFVASIVLASVVIAGCTKSATNTTNNTTNTAKASPSVSTATATPPVTKKPQATVTTTPTATPKPTPIPTPASQVHYGPFYASKESNKYHYSWCRYVNNIKPANLITFDTAEQAKAAGYIPCSVCKPP